MNFSYFDLEREASRKKYQRSINELQAKIDFLLEELDKKTRQLDLVLGVQECDPKPVVIPPPSRLKKNNRHRHESVAVAVASDWHVEEVVEASAVNGLNEYNLNIADTRIKKFFTNIVRLTETERHGTDIATLVLFLGGDLMTGYIHEELEESNALSPVETVDWLFERISGGVKYLQEHGGYDKIIIPCAFGNHGRTQKKPRVSTAAANSYEWLLYKMLAKSVKGPEWIVSDGYHLYTEIFGKTIRWHHGDAIVYNGGVGGLTIPTNKKIAEWDKAKRADLDVFGHYHQFQQSPKWCSNGSLIGYGPYSIRIGAGYEPPQQTFFLLDEKRGRTGTWPIFCD